MLPTASLWAAFLASHSCTASNTSAFLNTLIYFLLYFFSCFFYALGKHKIQSYNWSAIGVLYSVFAVYCLINNPTDERIATQPKPNQGTIVGIKKTKKTFKHQQLLLKK